MNARPPAAILWTLAIGGCTYLGSARSFDPGDLEGDAGWIAVQRVPPLRQKSEEGCGLAAMAMVLSYWRGSVTIEDLAAACPPIPGEGSPAGSLRGLARSRGFQAFLIHGEQVDLERELSEGRPVLVGLIKPYCTGVIAHYEVVVGLHRAGRRIVTLDPARGWTVNTLDGFLAEWDPAGRPALVISPKGDGP